MSFIVSARKYRPKRFDEVVGQKHVSQTLKNALQNEKVAHAFLFCGPRGVGKTTCARILAKVLNCESPTSDMEACDTCPSCTSFNENASFNIHELDAASNNSVEHIRALTDQVRFQPQQGKYKVYIIDEVHMLSQAAFNAFLKTLEEPPPYAIFILATTEKHKIIPTILSRCQIFDFKRISIPDIVQHLKYICDQEEINADPDALHIIAEKADGALRDGLSIFDRIVSFSDKEFSYEDVISNLNILDYDYYFKITEYLTTENVSALLLSFSEIISKGFEPDLFINGLANHFRNLLVCQDASTMPLLEVGDSIKERYRKQASLCNPSFIVSALALANDCDVNYKMARNKRLHVEMCLIKMCYIERALQLNGLPLSSEQLSQKKSDVATPSDSSQIEVESEINDSSEVQSENPNSKEIDTSGTDEGKEHEETLDQEVTKQGDDSETSMEIDLETADEQQSELEIESTSELDNGQEQKAEVKEVSVVEQEVKTELEPGLEPSLQSSQILKEITAKVEPDVSNEPQVSMVEETAIPFGSSAKSGDLLTTLKAEIADSTTLLKDSISVTSLNSMELAIEAEIKENENDDEIEITPELLSEVWKKYSETVSSRSAKIYFETAEIAIEDGEIIVTTGSNVGEAYIRNDTNLLSYLSSELKIRNPKLKFEIDKSNMIEEPEVKKPITDKEKYQLLRSENDKLDELQKRFDLRLDL